MILFSTVLIVFAFQQPVTPELRRHVEAGLAAKAANDLSTAAREFRLVTELAPTLPAAYVNLGAVYVAQHDYAAAIPPLRRALELDNNLPGVHAMLGTALLARGYANDALPHLENARTPDLLGVALLEAGRPRDAVDHLEAALRLRPNDPDLLYYLGQALGRASQQVFATLQHTAPASPRAQQLQAELFAAAGRSAEAESHFRAALATRPDLHGIHLALGDLALAAQDYERAEAEYQSEANLAPGSAIAAYKLGTVLLDRGRVPDALTALRRADQLQPRMPETLLALGKALQTSGDSAAAAAVLEQLLSIESTTKLAAAAHFQLAQAYRRLGKPADADRELKLFQSLKSTAAPERETPARATSR